MSRTIQLPHREYMEDVIAANERTIEAQQQRIYKLRAKLAAANREIRRLERRIESKSANRG